MADPTPSRKPDPTFARVHPEVLDPAAARDGRLAMLVIRLYTDDERSTEEVGRLIGRSRARVQQILKAYGIPARSAAAAHAIARSRPGARYRPPRTPTPRQAQALARGYRDQGYSASELARRTGIPLATVLTTLRTHGITPRGQTPRSRARLAAAAARQLRRPKTLPERRALAEVRRAHLRHLSDAARRAALRVRTTAAQERAIVRAYLAAGGARGTIARLARAFGVGRRVITRVLDATHVRAPRRETRPATARQRAG